MAEKETPSGHADDLRQRAEAAQGEADRLARATLDALSTHLAILDETGVIIAVNRAWRNFAQANPPPLSNVCEGANYLAVYDAARGADAEQAAAFAAAVRAVMRGELKESSLQYPCHSSGEQRWFNVRATRFFAEGAVRVVVAHENITGRKRAEEVLRASERKFHTVVDNFPEVIARFDQQLRHIYVSPSVGQYTGLPAETYLGKTNEELGMPAKNLALWNKHLRRVFETGERESFEFEFRKADRSHVFASLLVPEFGEDGAVESVMGIIRDITSFKQAQETLRQFSGELLRVQDEERRRVARELHDTVAQGLAALSLNLSLLQSPAMALNPRSKKLLADSQALVDQCVKEIRTSSYLLHPPILDELGLAGAIRDHADGFAHRTGLRVDLELPPDPVRLPRETELALFRVLQEALANIQHHSGSKTASIRVAQTADDIRLEVRDQGRGMVPKTVPAPERGHLVRFGPPMFTGAGGGLNDAQSGLEARAPGAVSGSAPLGMGIFGMRERMRQLGGRLEIQSDCHGTLVIATVPRRR